METIPLLDNVIWHSLSGAQVGFSSGNETVRRYASGFSPIIGFADPANPDFKSLAPLCNEGEHFYTDIWSDPVPADWNLDYESTMFKMIWTGDLPKIDEAPDAVPLTREHAQQALELATLTRPGPFGLRTIELGEYFGYFHDGRLIAMAGERMQAGSLREISGVCTHPDFQGHGFAKKLMNKLIRRQMLRNERTFLHVMSANTTARRLYERMGFENYLETVVRVITPRSA